MKATVRVVVGLIPLALVLAAVFTIVREAERAAVLAFVMVASTVGELARPRPHRRRFRRGAVRAVVPRGVSRMNPSHPALKERRRIWKL